MAEPLPGPPPLSPRPSPPAPRTIAIVGTGVAGATAALTLREEGFDGRIVLVGEEPEEPYRRPPLSKDLLTGAPPAGRLRLRPPAAWAERDIDLLTGTEVTGIGGPALDALEFADGSRLPYDRLLLATGARPRALPGAAGDGRVHTLRTLADLPGLRADLESGGPLLVVGAGLIGLEVAATAREMGCEVTVLEAADRALARVLPPGLGRAVLDLHRARGVPVHTGVRLRSVVRRGRTLVATGDDGVSRPAGAVLVAIGAEPATGLAERAGLGVADGILVDAYGATSAPHVHAAGDVARCPDPILGGSHRAEQWNHAREHGAAVAANMLGRDRPFAAAPWGWTDQYGVTLQFCGHPAAGDDITVEGDPAAFDFSAVVRRGGRVVGGAAAGRPAAFRAVRELLAGRPGAGAAPALAGPERG